MTAMAAGNSRNRRLRKNLSGSELASRERAKTKPLRTKKVTTAPIPFEDAAISLLARASSQPYAGELGPLAADVIADHRKGCDAT